MLEKLVKNSVLFTDVNMENVSDEWDQMANAIEVYLDNMLNNPSLGDIGYYENFFYRETPLGIHWKHYLNSTIEAVLKAHKQHIIELFGLY